MTPSETIAAAIEKLERMKAESTQEAWKVLEVNYFGPAAHLSVTQCGWDNADDSVPPFQNRVDAHLIVTLHATIEPTLIWLRDQLRRMNADVDATSEASQRIHYKHSLALAVAILGEQNQ